MPYRKVGSGQIALLQPSTTVQLGSDPLPANNVKRMIVLIWGGGGGGTKVNALLFLGAIDSGGGAYPGDRNFSINLGAANPVGLSRSAGIAYAWAEGNHAPGSGSWVRWPYPMIAIYVSTDATAGNAIGVNWEVWMDDEGLIADRQQTSLT